MRVKSILIYQLICFNMLPTRGRRVGASKQWNIRCYCCHGNCDSNTKSLNFDINIKMLPFPKPCSKHFSTLVDKSKKHDTTTCIQCTKAKHWIHLCKRADGKLRTLTDINKNTYICSKHFVDLNGPTESHPDPFPVDQDPSLVEKVISRCRKRPAERHTPPKPKSRSTSPPSPQILSDDCETSAADPNKDQHTILDHGYSASEYMTGCCPSKHRLFKNVAETLFSQNLTVRFDNETISITLDDGLENVHCIIDRTFQEQEHIMESQDARRIMPAGKCFESARRLSPRALNLQNMHSVARDNESAVTLEEPPEVIKEYQQETKHQYVFISTTDQDFSSKSALSSPEDFDEEKDPLSLDHEEKFVPCGDYQTNPKWCGIGTSLLEQSDVKSEVRVKVEEDDLVIKTSSNGTEVKIRKQLSLFSSDIWNGEFIEADDSCRRGQLPKEASPTVGDLQVGRPTVKSAPSLTAKYRKKSPILRDNSWEEKLTGSDGSKQQGGPVFKCPVCAPEFVDEFQMKEHETHCGVNRCQFSCNLCLELFPNEPALKAHKEVLHPKEVFLCDSCGFIFSANYAQCLVCKRNFRSTVKSDIKVKLEENDLQIRTPVIETEDIQIQMIETCSDWGGGNEMDDLNQGGTLRQTAAESESVIKEELEEEVPHRRMQPVDCRLDWEGVNEMDDLSPRGTLLRQTFEPNETEEVDQLQSILEEKSNLDDENTEDINRGHAPCSQAANKSFVWAKAKEDASQIGMEVKSQNQPAECRLDHDGENEQESLNQQVGIEGYVWAVDDGDAPGVRISLGETKAAAKGCKWPIQLKSVQESAVESVLKAREDYRTAQSSKSKGRKQLGVCESESRDEKLKGCLLSEGYQSENKMDCLNKEVALLRQSAVNSVAGVKEDGRTSRKQLLICKSETWDEESKDKVALNRPGHIYRCAVCDMRFLHKSEVNEHKRHCFDKKPMQQCQLCPKQFWNYRQLAVHKRRNHPQKVFNCLECDDSFWTKYGLKCHVCDKDYSAKRRLKCRLCRRMFATEHTLLYHKCVPIALKGKLRQ